MDLKLPQTSNHYLTENYVKKQISEGKDFYIDIEKTSYRKLFSCLEPSERPNLKEIFGGVVVDVYPKSKNEIWIMADVFYSDDTQDDDEDVERFFLKDCKNANEALNFLFTYVNSTKAWDVQTNRGFKTATYGRKGHRDNITQLENSVRKMF